MMKYFVSENQNQVNVIFLDIDGVLLINSNGRNNKKKHDENIDMVKEKLGHEYEKLDLYDIGAALCFEQTAIDNLRQLCERYNAKIVISSNWRVSNNRDKSMFKLTRLFKLWGLDHLIIDVTPTCSGSRAAEIKQWLDTTKYDVRSYAILDDVDDGLAKEFAEKFIDTSDSRYFSSAHYEQACSIFEKSHEPVFGM